MEARDEVGEIGVCVAVMRIEQRARQHRQPMAQAGGGFRIAGVFHRLRMQREEDAAQAGIFADQQRLDAAVLEELHRHALERAPVVGDLRLGPAAVADHVGEHGAVAVDAALRRVRILTAVVRMASDTSSCTRRRMPSLS